MIGSTKNTSRHTINKSCTKSIRPIFLWYLNRGDKGPGDFQEMTILPFSQQLRSVGGSRDKTFVTQFRFSANTTEDS